MQTNDMFCSGQILFKFTELENKNVIKIEQKYYVQIIDQKKTLQLDIKIFEIDACFTML